MLYIELKKRIKMSDTLMGRELARYIPSATETDPEYAAWCNMSFKEYLKEIASLVREIKEAVFSKKR